MDSFKMTLDDIDKRILNIIQENAKLPYHEIGKTLGLAASTVHSRVKKLEEVGLIRSFNAIVSPEKVGYKIIAWLGLAADPTKLKDIATKLAAYDQVQIVATSSGDHDIVAQVIAKDVKSLWRFINKKVKTIAGIKSEMDVSGFIDVYKMTPIVKLQENTE